VEGGDGLTDSTATQVDTITINVDDTNGPTLASVYSATINGTTFSFTTTAAERVGALAGTDTQADAALMAAKLLAEIQLDANHLAGGGTTYAAAGYTAAVGGTAGTDDHTIIITAAAAGTTFTSSGSTTDSTGGINTENTTGKISVQLSREGLFRQDSNGDGLVTTDAKDLLDSTTNASLSDFSVADFVNFIQNAASTRADNGATMSRLEASHAMLTTNHANIEAARSRLMDVDIAMESTHFARHNILVQSSAAMLSQANGIPNIALQLLG
jgi:flagellin-like hook-associated protein FlgL